MAVPGALAPIPPPESNAWIPRMRRVFQQQYTDMLAEVRGVGSAGDLDPYLADGYVYVNPDQRNSVALQQYSQGARGSMAPVPTPQELIRQVTGIGDPVRGR